MKTSIGEKLPPLIPRWRSVLNAFRLVRDPIPLLQENITTYGRTYSFHVGGMRKGILTVEPEIIRHVLQKNHRNYTKSNLQTGVLSQYLGNGLLTSEGQAWLRQRRIIQPAFHRDKLALLIKDMEEEINASISRLNFSGNTCEVDIYTVMHQLTFRIIVRAIFSSELAEDKIQKLSKNITRIQSMITRQIRQPYFLSYFRLSGMIKKHMDLASEAREILLSLIRERRLGGTPKDDLLQLMLEARYEDGTGMTDEQILDEAMILFVAGHETSANALSWAFYLIADRPEVVLSLREEWELKQEPVFDLAFGSEGWTYTRMVLNEVMRLYPPAWIIDRLSIEGDTIGGYQFPAGTFFILFIYGMHRDGDNWEEPEIFNPSRFDESKFPGVREKAFLPFGAGPRMCIGNNFALLEMQLILRAFLKGFDVKLIEGRSVKSQPLVTLRPKDGIHVRLFRRA